jgi:hypothetical protein
MVVDGWWRSGRGGTARENGRVGAVGGLSRTAAMLAHALVILHDTRSQRCTEVSLEFSKANALHAISVNRAAPADKKREVILIAARTVGVRSMLSETRISVG